MFRNLKILTGIIIGIVIATSCDGVRGDMSRCEVWLKFIYDYNMMGVDAFQKQVKNVDVYVFGEDDKFVEQIHTDTIAQLTGNNMMFLDNNLPIGTYKIVTIGGLNDKFRVVDAQGGECVPGTTLLSEVHVGLVNQTDRVDYEFPDIWVSNLVTVSNHNGDITVPVPLIKDTHRFHLSIVMHNDEEPSRSEEGKVPYTFEITTPDNIIQAADNSPIAGKTVTYAPYYLANGTDAKTIANATINTLRLVDGKEKGHYKIVIRSTETNAEVWSYDLMAILEGLKPNDAKGAGMSMQEFLDREDEWNIVILSDYLNKGPEGEDDESSFTVLGIQIGDWIMWLNNVNV